MSRRSDLAVAFLLPLLVCGEMGALLHAQAPEPPYERLLLTLLDGTGDGEVMVETVPDGFPVELLPEGADILGSAVTRGRTVVAVALPLPRRAAEGLMRRAFLDAGWSYAPVGERSGFMNAVSPTPPPHDRPPIFCRGEETVRFTSRPADTGSTMQFQWRTGSSLSWCHGGPTAAARIPILRAPASVTLVGGGGASSFDHLGQAQSFAETSLSPAELVEHFAEQLAATGWTLGARVDGESHASRELTWVDEAGAEWVGLLSATWIPRMQWHELRLVVMQPDALRRN